MEKPETLNKIDPNYPKALYKAKSQGDEKSPAYEKIVMNESGQAQRQKEYYPYETALVRDAKEEKELLKDGWLERL
jgi:hypothetical protein